MDSNLSATVKLVIRCFLEEINGNKLKISCQFVDFKDAVGFARYDLHYDNF